MSYRLVPYEAPAAMGGMVGTVEAIDPASLRLTLVAGRPERRSPRGKVLAPAVAPQVRVSGPRGGLLIADSARLRAEAVRLHAAADLLDAHIEAEPLPGQLSLEVTTP